MNKRVVVSLSALLALVALADVAAAQEGTRKRRVGFLERLFGSGGGNGGGNDDFSQPRRFGKRAPAWWETDDSGVRIIRGGREDGGKKKIAAKPKPKAVPAVAIDPDVAEGLGMGNKDYVLPKLVSVVEAGLSKNMVFEPEASAIKLVLTDKATSIKATDAVRKAVLAHYEANGFKPLWTKDGGIDARGLAVLGVLSKAADEGLEPLRYKPVVLADFSTPSAQLDGDGLGLAQFDVGLSVAAITYAMHVSGGAFDPAALSAYHDLKPQSASPEVAMRVLAYSPFPAEYLKQQAPTHAAYGLLKQALQTLAAAKPEAVERFAEGKRIRIGQKDPRIVQLRKRMVADGHISLADASVDAEKQSTLDKVLAKALKAFQEAEGIGQTSNLDTATVNALNGPDTSELRDKLISSMERVRWLPKDLGRRHVLVNQASYRVNVLEDGKVIWASNVIVGKPLTQTAVFSDTFETVVFNPTWGVPQSIILNEYLPKLRANPGYLDKIGFKTIGKNGKPVSSRSINWNAVGANSGIGIMQPAGDGNALGEVKFLFPNSHSIYMHDTPNRGLFANAKRNFSHGCVRVENPREFAQVLLGWDAGRVDTEIEQGETANVKVTKPTNVHLAYFTAWPDENGIVRYHSDAYGRDQTLKKARELVAKSVGASGGNAKVVADVTLSGGQLTD